jgi:hypothetical protein
MFTLRKECEGGDPLTEQIRSLLRSRHAMHLGELCVRLGVDEQTLRERLERMMSEGEVERLTPVDLPGQPRADWDFFRLFGPGPIGESRDRRRARRDGGITDYARVAGEAMACLAD